MTELPKSSGTDWSMYAACDTCMADEGGICRHLTPRRGQGGLFPEGGCRPLVHPHPGRTTIEKRNKMLDRATRTAVLQYFNGDEPEPDRHFDRTLGEVVPEVKEFILTLLDRCAGVEAVTKRGMTPRVPVSEIRDMLADKLGGGQ